MVLRRGCTPGKGRMYIHVVGQRDALAQTGVAVCSRFRNIIRLRP